MINSDGNWQNVNEASQSIMRMEFLEFVLADGGVNSDDLLS